MTNAVIFDLDGTLVDSAPDILAALNYSFEHENMTPLDDFAIKRLIGNGSWVMFERALTLQNITPEHELIERLKSHFDDFYRTHIPGATRLFEGAKEAIERLCDAGFILAVCTNKDQNLAEQLLKYLGVSQHFTAICGGDSFRWKKPDPRHLLETIKRIGGSVGQTVLVGDSKTDVATAHAATIPVIAVDFGYSQQPIETYNPSVVISAFDELTIDLVVNLIKRDEK